MGNIYLKNYSAGAKFCAAATNVSCNSFENETWALAVAKNCGYVKAPFPSGVPIASVLVTATASGKYRWALPCWDIHLIEVFYSKKKSTITSFIFDRLRMKSALELSNLPNVIRFGHKLSKTLLSFYQIAAMAYPHLS